MHNSSMLINKKAFITHNQEYFTKYPPFKNQDLQVRNCLGVKKTQQDFFLIFYELRFEKFISFYLYPEKEIKRGALIRKLSIFELFLVIFARCVYLRFLILIILFNLKDYITEKFFRILKYNIIPVVLNGASTDFYVKVFVLQ